MSTTKIIELDVQEFTKSLCSELYLMDFEHFSVPWTKNNWNDLINTYDNNYKIFLILDYNKIVGFSLFKLSQYEKLAHLLKIILIEKYQGKNLGSFLLSHSLEMLSVQEYSKIYLEVETTNTPAISLYYKLGFSKSHQINNYYSNGCSAQVMVNYDCCN